MIDSFYDSVKAKLTIRRFNETHGWLLPSIKSIKSLFLLGGKGPGEIRNRTVLTSYAYGGFHAIENSEDYPDVINVEGVHLRPQILCKPLQLCCIVHDIHCWGRAHYMVYEETFWPGNKDRDASARARFRTSWRQKS